MQKREHTQPNGTGAQGTAFHCPTSKNAETNNMFTEQKQPVANYTTTWELVILRICIQEH